MSCAAVNSNCRWVLVSTAFLSIYQISSAKCAVSSAIALAYQIPGPDAASQVVCVYTVQVPADPFLFASKQSALLRLGSDPDSPVQTPATG